MFQRTVLSLSPGESRLFHAAAGSRWTVAAGRVRLTAPLRDLGGRAVAAEVRLAEGDSHVIESGGWIRIEAPSASRLHVEAAAAPASRRWRLAFPRPA